MADYSDYPGGKNYEPLGDRIGRRYMEHAGDGHRLATDEVNDTENDEISQSDDGPENTMSEFEEGRQQGYAQGYEDAKAQALINIVKVITAL